MKFPKFNLPLITFLSVAVGCTLLSRVETFTPIDHEPLTMNEVFFATDTNVHALEFKTVVTAPKTAVTALKASRLVVPTGCAMAIDETFTQAEINEFCAPKPTASQVTATDNAIANEMITANKKRVAAFNANGRKY